MAYSILEMNLAVGGKEYDLKGWYPVNILKNEFKSYRKEEREVGGNVLLLCFIMDLLCYGV